MGKEKEETKDKFVVGQVATQVAAAIIDSETGKALTMEEAMSRIMNDVAEIRKKF